MMHGLWRSTVCLTLGFRFEDTGVLGRKGQHPTVSAMIHGSLVGKTQAAIEPAVDLPSDDAAGGTMSARTKSLG